jgi:hypothetical protein
MSIEMTPKPRRELILDAVSDLATDPLNYDQKRTSTCPAARSGKTFEAGETTPEEIASRIGTPRLTRCEMSSRCGIQP